MNRFTAIALLVVAAFLLSSAPSRAAYSTSQQTASASVSQQLVLVIPPAVEATVISSPAPEQSGQDINQQFVLGIRANTAWALSTQITTTAINAGTCQPANEPGPRNQDNGYQLVSVDCQQPLSWADQPGIAQITWQVAPALSGGGIND